jgi:hypothetical protein
MNLNLPNLYPMKQGGDTNTSTINIEKGELGINEKGKVIEDYTDNRFSKHSVAGKENPNNIIQTAADFIIPAKYAKIYKEGDRIVRQGIIREVGRNAGSPSYVAKKGGMVPKYGEGGLTIGGITYTSNLLEPVRTGGNLVGYRYNGKVVPIEHFRAIEKYATRDNSGNITSFSETNANPIGVVEATFGNEYNPRRADEIIRDMIGVEEKPVGSSEPKSDGDINTKSNGQNIPFVDQNLSRFPGTADMKNRTQTTEVPTQGKISTREQFKRESFTSPYDNYISNLKQPELNAPSIASETPTNDIPNPVRLENDLSQIGATNPNDQLLSTAGKVATGAALGGGLGGLLTYAPTVFNAIAGLQKPEQFDPYYNPNEQESMDLLKSRTIDDNQVQNRISRQRGVADRNARIGVSTSGGIHSRLRQNYTTAANASAEANLQAQHLNNQYTADTANALNSFGQQRVQSQYATQGLNNQIRSNRTNFLTSAVSGLSSAYQNERNNNLLSNLVFQANPELQALQKRGANQKIEEQNNVRNNRKLNRNIRKSNRH